MDERTGEERRGGSGKLADGRKVSNDCFGDEAVVAVYICGRDVCGR